MSENNTMLSRSGKTSPDGKLGRRLDVPVSEELEAAVISLATIQGISKAEWVRYHLEEIVHGKLSMLRRMTQQGQGRQWDESRSDVA
jgi:hypothetical protein